VTNELTVDHLSVLAVLRSGASADADAIAAELDLDADVVEDLLSISRSVASFAHHSPQGSHLAN